MSAKTGLKGRQNAPSPTKPDATVLKKLGSQSLMWHEAPVQFPRLLSGALIDLDGLAPKAPFFEVGGM